ncbi:MAG: thioredoxin fold domain-containing protein [Woeseiaceae bacterium]
MQVNVKHSVNDFGVLFAITLLLFYGQLLQAEELKPVTDAIQSDLVNPGYHEKPTWFKSSFLDLREDVAEATENKKRVLLYFYQDGCPYCAKLLQDNLGQKHIADKTRKNFDVIAINMWGDKEVTDLKGKVTTEKLFSESMKVMYTPTLVFLTELEKIALRVNGYYAPNKYVAALNYVSGHHETKTSFRNFVKQTIKPSSSGKIHREKFILKPPYNLKTLLASNKPLLVLFEQKRCLSCDELHNDILKRKATIEQLQRFNVVQLDTWSHNALVGFDGEETTSKKLSRKLNVMYAPSFVFFNNKGKEVFRIDAYLKSFHVQSVLDYVASKAYLKQPNFQRYISLRAESLEANGVHINLMD